MNDHLLLLAADLLDDLERTRIATDNRLRSLAAFGLDGTPEYSSLAATAEGVTALERAAALSLQRLVKQHVLGPWVASTKGIGLKTAGRLLASIGDPYWNTLHDRPRTVSELWAFCGLHVVPVAHSGSDARQTDGSGDDPHLPVVVQRTSDLHGSSDGDRDQTTGGRLDQRCGETPITSEETVPGVAPRRTRGQRVNWSTKAKTRAYLVAISCVKVRSSPYRTVYDDRRAHTAETRPAWTAGHSHNDAVRVTAKAILRDMWLWAREARHDESTATEAAHAC